MICIWEDKAGEQLDISNLWHFFFEINNSELKEFQARTTLLANQIEAKAPLPFHALKFITFFLEDPTGSLLPDNNFFLFPLLVIFSLSFSNMPVKNICCIGAGYVGM